LGEGARGRRPLPPSPKPPPPTPIRGKTYGEVGTRGPAFPSNFSFYITGQGRQPLHGKCYNFIMSVSFLPPPETVGAILIWHQGALGDLLLAGPALAAVRKRYPQARITALGQPERWALLAPELSLAAVWDSGEAQWASLYSEAEPPPVLRERLAAFQLALVFGPRPQGVLLQNLARAGIPRLHWIPSFSEGGREPVAEMQARHLAGLGMEYEPQIFSLGWAAKADSGWVDGEGPWLAVAPGSGNPKKNWPLSHFYEAARALAWEQRMGVIWLAGPAEAAILPYVAGLAAAQGQVVAAGQSLGQVAAILSRCRLYLGNDAGLTHLAAAAGVGQVVAIFGPTDSRVWGPRGENVTIMHGTCELAPCAVGREISCPEPRCLEGLTPAMVVDTAGAKLAES
jgi:ADP-heptose:LPS heptosyltransferase